MIILLPSRVRAEAGAVRTGLARWRSEGAAARLSVTLPRWFRPRFLLVLALGIDASLSPVLTALDRQGAERGRLAVGRTGRLVCRLRVLDAREIAHLRIEPGPRPAAFRLLVLGTSFAAIARIVARQLTRIRPAVGPSRFLQADLRDLAGNATNEARFPTDGSHHRHMLELEREDAERSPPVAADTDPFLSLLVPVYNTKPRYLDDLLRSVRDQVPGAELILSDDGSTASETRAWLDRHRDVSGLRVLRNDRNGGIAAATNAALALVRTPWIGLLDHDDVLQPGAIRLIARALKQRPEAEFVYTDEVVVDDVLKPVGLYLKPAYDPVLLSGVNYVNHLSLYRTDRVRALGGLRDGFQGSQDFDLLLRYLAGLDPARVLHLPYPAYGWRRSGESFSAEFEGESVAQARRVLALHHGTGGGLAKVEPALFPSLHRVRFDANRRDWPRVSVVIPSRDALDLLRTTLTGLREGTDYPDLEIVVVDNGSTDAAVLDFYERIRAADPRVRVAIRSEPFNFSRSSNRGAALATGDFVLFLNNDVEVVDRAWLKEMVSCFAYPGTGIVGARLLYPDGTLQHAGVIVGYGGLAGHWFLGKRDDEPGPMARLLVRQSMSAVTGAAMLVSRSCLDAVGGFDEERFAVAYNDVDLCLRAREAGFRTVWTPLATLIHHESASRGSDERPDTIERFRREQRHLAARHGTADFEDPTLNPWYTRDRSTPEPRVLDVLPDAR